MVPEKIYDALVSARTADKVTLFFRDGRAVSGALIFNPFKGSGRVIDVDKERARLKKDLEAVVKNEDFEKAAQLRDRIKSLELELNR